MKKNVWWSKQILPQTNSYLAWLRTPIGWLIIAAIACALVASSLAPQMWLVFGMLVTLMLIGVLWPLIAMLAVTCELKFNLRRCDENSKVKVQLLITNRFWIPVWGLSLEKGFFHDEKKQIGEESGIAIALARIPAASTSEFVWEFIPARRGIYPFRFPVLTCGFPFGLWFSKKPVEACQHLIVWPETFRLGFIPPALGSHQLVSETYTDHSGTVGDRIGVRPYRDGDSLRLVSWAHTARIGELIVSEQQSPSRQWVTVVIDANLQTQRIVDAGGNDESGEPVLDQLGLAEDCLRIGASICSEFHSHGYQVRCHIGAAKFTIDARDSSFRDFMDRLARFEFEESGRHAADGLLDPNSVCFRVTSGEKTGDDQSSVNLIRVRHPMESDDSTSAISDAWIDTRGGVALGKEFPRKWIRACHQYWQVSG